MTPETKIQLGKRFKSLLWRLGAYAAVALISFIVDNIGLLKLSPGVVTVIALVLGEVTKWINKQVQLGKAKK